MSSIKDALGMVNRVSHAVSALSHASEAVPEVAGHFSGPAAASIGMVNPQAAAPVPAMPFAPFYNPPVPVSDDEIRGEVDVRVKFILARLRFGSKVVRNLVAEIVVKSSDQQLVDDWTKNVSGSAEPGSMVAKAQKRLAVRERLKTYDSPVTTDDGELVEMLKEGMYLDLLDQAQRGSFKKMSYDQMFSKIISIEFFGVAEAIVEPLAELAKDSLAKK